MNFSLIMINMYFKIEEFALIGLALNFLGGIWANIFWASICDWLEPKGYLRTKAYVASFQAFLAAVCYFFMFFFFKSFAMLCVFKAVEEFFCEGITAPSLSMMTTTAPNGTDASVMGLFMIVTNISVLITSVILSQIVTEQSDLFTISMTLTWSIVPCFLLASFCFFMSNFDYHDRVSRINNERANTVA